MPELVTLNVTVSWRLTVNRRIRPAVALVCLLTAWGIGAVAASAAVQASNPAWAGYSASNPTTSVVFNRVTATWKQPRIACKPREQSEAWFLVGLDGPTNNADEQA